MFTGHKFLLVTVKELLKSVLNYRSYPKNKTGYPLFGPPFTHYVYSPMQRNFCCIWRNKFCTNLKVIKFSKKRSNNSLDRRLNV